VRQELCHTLDYSEFPPVDPQKSLRRVEGMKQRIKQWWNGKAVIVDDGGYAPYVAQKRPWLRKLYDKHPVIAPTIGVGLTSAICTEVVGRLAKAILGS
jgi:hypothetical protein